MGCGSDTYNQSIKQAKEAVAKGDFDLALASFEAALDEKALDDTSKQSYKQLAAYQQLKEDIENEKWRKALDKATAMLEQDLLNHSLRKKVEEYKKMSVNNIEKEKSIPMHINTTKEIKNQKETAKIKNTYLAKLELVTKETEAQSAKYASYSTAEYRMVEEVNFRMWDDLLNEIYGELQQQLSTSEMNKLRVVQREWISYRDTYAEKGIESFEGAWQGAQYAINLAYITKQRCYELVEEYL